MNPLRTRLLLSLSLVIAGTGAACSKSKKGPWVPEAKYGICTSGCPCGVFCTEQPQITHTSDASALHAACGGSAEIPASVAKVPSMAGHDAYLTFVTADVRKDYPKACCYTYETEPCGKGRPLRDERGLVLAPEIESRDWTCSDEATLRAGAELRARFSRRDLAYFAEHMRHVARMEHGSVAAFARVSLELLALGAPPDLVIGAHEAAMDEIRHARTCWALAAAMGEQPIGPGPLVLPRFEAPRRDLVLAATIVEGCVGETFGSALLAEAARSCEASSLAGILSGIADDEERHAALAFRIVRFLGASRREIDDVLASVVIEGTECANIPALAMFGRAAQREVFQRTFDEVVVPVLNACCATPATRSRAAGRASGLQSV